MLKTSFSSIVSQLHAMLKTGKSCICERSSLARIAPCTAALFHCFIRVVGPMGSFAIGAFRTLVCTKSIGLLRSMPLRCSTLSPPSSCLQSRQRVRHQADGLVRLLVVGELWIMDCDWDSVELLTHTRPCTFFCSVSLSSCHQKSMNSWARSHVQ